MCDRRCAVVILVKSDGWITVCGTDVVVILLKRVRDGSKTVCGTGVVVILVKRVRDGSQYVGQALLW